MLYDRYQVKPLVPSTSAAGDLPQSGGTLLIYVIKHGEVEQVLN